MTEDNTLIAERKKKLTDWEAHGFSGYAFKFDRTHTAAAGQVAAEKFSKKWRDAAEILKKGPTFDIKMCGRVVNFREMGKLVFLRLRDVSGDFQVVLAQDVFGQNFKPYTKMLDLGDFVGFFGEFFMTNHGEPTLLAAKIMPLSKSIRPLPEKWAGLKNIEECYRNRHLDLISNPDTLKRFQLRSAIIKEIRGFLEDKDFMEVETRTLQLQAGGAMAKVFKTHHNALDQELVLRISLELEHKILVAGGIERLYEIGKCFRNEGTDPSHLQEFTMLEWYCAYADLDTNMQWTEDMIRQICTKVFKTTKITVLNEAGESIQADFGKKFPRKFFPDLLKEYANIDMSAITRKELEKVCIEKYEMSVAEAKKTARGNLLDYVYKKTVRPHLIQPTFVLDYPSDVKPLARPKENGTADCYQLLVAGWEVVNSYGELTDPQVQRKLLEEQATAKAAGDDEAMEVDEDFLGAMEVGMPPMTGFGMGIDRFVALLTTQSNLRDVVFFPLMKPKDESPIAKKPVVSAQISAEKIEAGISRATAQKILEKYADKALQRHCAYVANAMESLCHHFDEVDKADAWYIAGLLHDVDWNHTIDNPAEHCGEMLQQILADHGVNSALLDIIRSHYPLKEIPLDSKIKQALFACDELCGFTVAVALMRPTKMIGISPKSVTKKMKDKQFAAAVSREDMKACEEFFGIPVSEFLGILIPGFEKIASKWELTS